MQTLVVEVTPGVQTDGDVAQDQLLRVSDDDDARPGVEADGSDVIHRGVAVYGRVLLPAVVD